MAGFHLPKFRWLLIGAIAAGGWAMMQEPPKREHWQRQRQAESASPAKPRASKPDQPRVASAPARRPTELITSSIPKPESRLAPRSKPQSKPAEPIAENAAKRSWTKEKVRLRGAASTTSAVLTMVKGGQRVEVLASDGDWRKVSVGGQTGWIRGDYLGAEAPSIAGTVPRPKTDVGQTPQPGEKTASVESVASDWGALRPSRAPQGGDCQCPYDLMLNGKQCGQRSAYAKGREASCYF